MSSFRVGANRMCAVPVQGMPKIAVPWLCKKCQKSLYTAQTLSPYSDKDHDDEDGGGGYDGDVDGDFDCHDDGDGDGDTDDYDDDACGGGGDDGGELHEVDDGERNSRDLLGKHPDPTTNDDVMCCLRNDLPYLGRTRIQPLRGLLHHTKESPLLTTEKLDSGRE